MSVASPAPIRLAPPTLWAIACAFLHSLHALFGDPAHVAMLHTLPAKTHRLMSSWLRCAEALMRRLILIEAAAYPKPNTRPLLREPRKRARKLMMFEADKPQDWRVGFHCFAPAPRTPRKTPDTRAAARLERLRQLGALPGQPLRIYREAQDDPTLTRALSPSKGGARRNALRHAPRSKPIRAQDRFWVHENDLTPPVFRSAWPLAERFEALLRVFNDPAAYARRIAARLHALPHRLAEALRAPPDASNRVDKFDEFRECAERSWRQHFSSA